MKPLFSILVFLYGYQFSEIGFSATANKKSEDDFSSHHLTVEKFFPTGNPEFIDTTPHAAGLVFEKKEILIAAPGTKSVLFNTGGTRLYAMNLEGMSISEFDRPTRKILREFQFRATKGMGWDYDGDSAISSYEEKPVEACFTNNDKILWVSLHNAGGIVPILVDSFQFYPKKIDTLATKHITVIYPGFALTDSFDAPLVKTGKTPKVIAKTSDDKNLLVSNWHSYSVSVLELYPDQYPYARVIKTIHVPAIPRGIAIDDKNYRSYIAIMGGASIAVVNNGTWKKGDEINVASNPRHIVLDTSGRLFVSYNHQSRIACINATTGKTLFTAPTHAQPRTIILSKNKQFLFVTCYNGNMIDVFKINKHGFKKLYSIECKGKPVGVDIYENDDVLEAWVCTYVNGAINVLTFKKSY